jgi:hypothetical protein
MVALVTNKMLEREEILEILVQTVLMPEPVSHSVLELYEGDLL